MNAADIVIIVILLIVVFFAIREIGKPKGCGCGCAGCTKNCAYKSGKA